MSQKDALTLCIVMLGAVSAFIAGYPGDDLAPLMRLPFGAIAAGCTVGLAFMDKLGAADDPAPKRRTAAEKRVDSLVERVGAKDAEKALQMFLEAKADGIAQR